jgi:hypothetical protein
MITRGIAASVAFAVGICAGLFLGSPSRKSQSPVIRTDFCFVLRNTDLFNDRPFLTTALIAVDIHGESLGSADCPEGGLPFSSTLDHRDSTVGTLDAEIASLSFGGEVPVTFVGTVRIPSRIESAYKSLKYRLGIKGVYYRESVVITRIISSGKALP